MGEVYARLAEFEQGNSMMGRLGFGAPNCRKSSVKLSKQSSEATTIRWRDPQQPTAARPRERDVVVCVRPAHEMLSRGDFMTWKDGCQLTETGRRAFFSAYEQRKATVVTHPVYGYRMSYSRMMEVQARMLAAYVRGTVPAYTGFTVR